MERAMLVIGSGGIVALLAVLIKYGGWMELIAGYDPERVDDEEGLADFIGTNALYVALITVLVGVLEYLAPAVEARWLWLPYVVVLFALTARMIRGAQRYESAPTDSPDASR